jgi:hypothetical protein
VTADSHLVAAGNRVRRRPAVRRQCSVLCRRNRTNKNCDHGGMQGASADRPLGIIVLSPSSRIDVSFSAPTPQGQSSAKAAEGRQHSVEGSGVPMSPFILGPWACAVPKWPLSKEPTWVTAARIETVVSQIRADWSSGVELNCVTELKGLTLIATPESVPSRPMANENRRKAIGGRLSLRIDHGEQDRKPTTHPGCHCADRATTDRGRPKGNTGAVNRIERSLG